MKTLPLQYSPPVGKARPGEWTIVMVDKATRVSRSIPGTSELALKAAVRKLQPSGAVVWLFDHRALPYEVCDSDRRNSRGHLQYLPA